MTVFKTIVLLLFSSSLAFSQTTVTISDPNFKACLVETLPQLLDENQQLIIDSAKAFQGNLKCVNKGITQIPELIYFESLTRLELNKNKLSSLPSLNNMTELNYLYVAENQLTELPELNQLSNLEQLICWKNKLTTLPDISLLHQLHRLDVPVNQLTTFPVLSPIAPMKTLLVDDNFITNLPDLSGYPLLQIVKVVNNRLSFDDLEMILTQPNPQIYDYYPQKFFEVLSPVTINEGENMTLSTGLDETNEAVHFEWLKNNSRFDTTSSIRFNPINLADSGKYRAVITSDLFPNKPLYTNSANIKVRECPSIEQLLINTTAARCTRDGEVVIENGTTKNTYQLSASASTLTSASGQFKNVKAGIYTLMVTHNSGCIRQLNETITIESVACKEVLITPDGDGNQDEFYFSESGTAVLYDKFGNKIRELELPTSWNGEANNQKVAPGYYNLDINNGETLIGITVLY